MVGSEDAVAALPLGPVRHNRSTVLAGHALVAETSVRLASDGGAADRHAESLRISPSAKSPQYKFQRNILNFQTGGETSKCGTYRRESLNWLSRQIILRQVKLGVVDSQTALGAVGPSQERLHRLRLDQMVGAILGVLEVHVRNPVVGEIIRHLARRAGGPLTNVAQHGGVECIASDDHVQMCGRQRAGLGRGVQPLGCEG